MRQIRKPYVIDGIPKGCYAGDAGKILLPKRKRGEKFVVHYTEVREAVL